LAVFPSGIWFGISKSDTNLKTMDRKTPRKAFTIKRVAFSSTLMVCLSFILYSFLFADNRSRLNVDSGQLTVSVVKEGVFQEFIPVTGNVMAGKSVFLDAVQHGTISQVYKESGALLKKGDTILTLANPNLQLSIMGQESQLYEQLNHLRNTRLALDQNSLSQQAVLAEIDYQLYLLQPQVVRFKQLLQKQLISQREFEEVKEQYDYNLKRKYITYASYKKDSLSRIQQLQQLNLSERRMMESLEAVRHILDDLIIKAPVEGQLASPELQPGKSVVAGERLGQIDVVNAYKVRVGIDEYYLPRVNSGQKGSFEFSGKIYHLLINKIFPTITNGKFEVDMEFVGQVPEGIKIGQSFQIRLELGNSAMAMLLPSGGFYKDTGGNWIFVIDPSGRKATKKHIKLGRKNPEFFEIIEGLKPGEKVITSSYKTFGDNEVIIMQ
jgi:HlyD family secretion protein